MAPVHILARRGQLEEVMRCIQKDPTIVDGIDHRGWTALIHASAFGHQDLVCYLLDHGADINIKDKCGISAVDRACEMGHLEVLDLLLSRGGNPLTTSRHGVTSLMWAAYGGHATLLRHLLKIQSVRGMMDSQGIGGRTALRFATCGGHADAIKVLVEEGINPMVVDKEGKRPVDIARENGNKECTAILQVRKKGRKEGEKQLSKRCLPY